MASRNLGLTNLFDVKIYISAESCKAGHKELVNVFYTKRIKSKIFMKAVSVAL